MPELSTLGSVVGALATSNGAAKTDLSNVGASTARAALSVYSQDEVDDLIPDISGKANTDLANVTTPSAAIVDTLSDRARSDLDVGAADYASIQAAIDSLAGKRICPGAVATINVSGHHSLTSALGLTHPDAARIQITGDPLLSRSFSSVTSVSGSAGAYTVRIPLDSQTDVASGDCLAITATSGDAGHELLRGGWKITARTSTYVDVLVTVQRGTIPTNASGTVKVYRTVLTFTGCTGIECGALGGLTNVALVGDGTASTFGFASAGSGDVYMTDVIVQGFGDDGVSPRNGVAVYGTRVYSTGNGNNGFNAREAGAALKLYACIASGNGNLTNFNAAGAGGFQAQFSGSMELGSVCESWGNYGDGFKARNGGSGIADTSNPAKAGWNNRNYVAGQAGMLQVSFCSGKRSNSHDFYAEDRGYLNATSATSDSPQNVGTSFYADDAKIRAVSASSTSATGNGFQATNGATIEATSATVTSATFNGFSATGDNSRITATSANVVSVGASAYIAAGRRCTVISTSAAGLTTRSPAANTYDSNYNYVLN